MILNMCTIFMLDFHVNLDTYYVQIMIERHSRIYYETEGVVENIEMARVKILPSKTCKRFSLESKFTSHSTMKASPT
jgi:hypothetical protein